MPPQLPALRPSIRDSEARPNHGAGIEMPPDSNLLHNFVHDNGEMGIGAGAGSGAIQDRGARHMDDKISGNDITLAAGHAWSRAGSRTRTASRKRRQGAMRAAEKFTGLRHAGRLPSVDTRVCTASPASRCQYSV